MAKILFYDIETFGMDFNADVGFIMAISYKWQGDKKITTLLRTNPRDSAQAAMNDKELLKQFIPAYEAADLIVTWNGVSFDNRFVQTRMLKHRLGYLPPAPQEDGLRTARQALKMRRSLENVGKFFGLKTQKEKMDFETIWFPAAFGDETAMKQVVKRCEADVLLLEEAYNLLAPLSRTHPNVNIIDGKPQGCPLCGKTKLQQRGTIPALRHYRIRFQCQNPKCGKWSSSQPIRVKEKI